MAGLSVVQMLADIALAPLHDNEEDIFLHHSSETTAEIVHFIRENFQKKVCMHFVAADFNKDNDGFPKQILCVCGSHRQDHPKSVGFGSITDMDNEFVGFFEELKPTDAFGEIRFYPSLSYQEPAQYVRLTDSSDPFAVLRLMCDHWKLTSPDPPSLVVSLVGGEMYCMSDIQTKEIFNRGLVKAIKSTQGWLLTDGLNIGVAKAVGAAVQEGQTLEWSQTQEFGGQHAIRCIGIAKWRQVQNKEALINRNPNIPSYVDYLVDPVVREGEALSLNPNHSHFFLVDAGVSSDGFQSQGTAEFRAALERQISLSKEDGGLDVPVVCLLVEGGLSGLQQVLNSVRQSLPAVICANSGRAADVLAWSLDQYKQIREIDDVYMRERAEYELQLRIKDRARYHDTLKHDDEAGYDLLADTIIDICPFYEQITTFRIGQNSSLDEALLLSILDSQHKADPLKQLELAQRWNRADVAARILNDPRHFFLTKKNIDRLMANLTLALIRNKVDFVRLYLDSGVPLKPFLTTDILCQIYVETVIGAPYLWNRLGISKSLLSRNKASRLTLEELVDLITLKNVNKALQSFGRRFRHPEYDDAKSNATFAEPLDHLFCWAVMLNREDLAVLFWERCNKPLINVIAGTVLCKCLSNLRGEAQASIRAKFARFKIRLEKLACGYIKETYKQNMSKAVLLVKRPSPVWGNLSSMALAGIAEDQKFLATECCQMAIKNTWKCGYTASSLQILYSVFLFLPIFFFVEFDKVPPTLCRCPAGACNCKRRQAEKKKALQIELRLERKSNSKGSDALDFLPDLECLYESVRKKPSEEIKLWFRRLFIFYYSPAVKFITHTVFYCLYLTLYAIVIFRFSGGEKLRMMALAANNGTNNGLKEWSFEPTTLEMTLYIWQATFVCEEIRIIFWHPGSTVMSKLVAWWVFSSLHTWNRLRLVSYLLAVIIVVVRSCNGIHAIAKALLVINFITFAAQMFKVYCINGYLGPKVFMMKRMVLDLVMFLLVFFVFYVCYSVSYHAFYEPKVDTTLPSILKVGIWEIFGEVNDEEITTGGSTLCEQELAFGAVVTECQIREGLILLLLILYLFCTAILMVNMLIATFTHTFDNIQSNSKQIWKYQMYFLVEEFRTKTILPEPLVLFEHIFLLIRHFIRRCTRGQLSPTDGTAWEASLTKTERHFLSVFESACRADYLERKKKKCGCVCGRCKCYVSKEKHKIIQDQPSADF